MDDTSQIVIQKVPGRTPSTDEPTFEHPPQRKHKSIIGILLVGLLIFFLGSSAIYFGLVVKKPVQQNQAINNPKSQVSPVVTLTLPEGQLFSGHIQKLNQGLGLLKMDDQSNPSQTIIDGSVIYFSAGTYRTGKYAGYTRYIALKQAMGTNAYVFASKDGQSYVYDGSPNDPMYAYFNKQKVITYDTLPTEHPTSIPLNSRFALARNSIISETNETIYKKDAKGNPVDEVRLGTDYNSLPTLVSPLPNVLLLQKQNQKAVFDYSVQDGNMYNISNLRDLSKSLIAGNTTTYAVDSTGLAYSYSLTTPQSIRQYDQLLFAYNKAVFTYQNDPTKPYPAYPQTPDLSFSTKGMQSSAPLFDTYSIALPSGCAMGGDTPIVNDILEKDLQKIGTSIYGDMYVLKDTNSPLLKTQYQDKVGWVLSNSKESESEFEQINNSQHAPTYEEYVKKNPLLLFKDNWGRWVMIGEFDIKLPGGCGKPVIYLYPPKPTSVSIQFLSPIAFDVAIPSYHTAWNVLAQPDGTLTDLQPQFTDCMLIDSNRFGSEYAKKACATNTYPYIYWAGSSTQKSYPAITKGWIVERAKVESFMGTKLDEIGFTPKEKTDFTTYWIPKMMRHTQPYFRISFLQNAEMNDIAPMEVKPFPTHYYRYFLDYLPIDSKPSDGIEEETLTKIVRSGFTLVEWGGYNR